MPILEPIKHSMTSNCILNLNTLRRAIAAFICAAGTRFKGLGEISPDEFAGFINHDIKLQPVMLLPDTHIQQLLEYYMGNNTPSRQDFIIDNLKVELDLIEESV